MAKLNKLYVSDKRLKAKGACPFARVRFRNTFGTGNVPVTKENWDRARTVDLDVAWLFRRKYGWEVYGNIVYPPTLWGASYNPNYLNDMWTYIKKAERINDNGQATS